MIILEKLARETAGFTEAQFVAAYPHPALVFFPGSVQSSGSPFATEMDMKSTHQGELSIEQVLENYGQQQAASRAPTGSAITAKSALWFVAKSERNPFAQMITVGRARNHDLVLGNATISKAHAYFTRAEDGWKLNDQGATNGTTVNGKRIPKNESLPLGQGALVKFGSEVRALFQTPQGLYGLLTRKSLV